MQIIKPINTDALNKWVGFYPPDVIRDMAQIAPMLARLGYDPAANPPIYGEPDALVRKKMDDVHQNVVEWEQRVKEIMDKQRRIQEEIDANVKRQEQQKQQPVNAEPPNDFGDNNAEKRQRR